MFIFNNLFDTYEVNISSTLDQQELKIHPMRSSLKPMREIMRVFKKHILADFVNAMRETPFGLIFMAFYNEEFGGDLKSNISLLKIVDLYDRESRSLLIGGKRVELTIEDVSLTFRLPISGTYFIMKG